MTGQAYCGATAFSLPMGHAKAWVRKGRQPAVKLVTIRRSEMAFTLRTKAKALCAAFVVVLLSVRQCRSKPSLGKGEAGKAFCVSLLCPLKACVDSLSIFVER